MANQGTVRNQDLYGQNQKSSSIGLAGSASASEVSCIQATQKMTIKRVFYNPDAAGTSPVGTITLKNGSNVIATIAKASGTFTAITPVELTVDTTYADVAINDVLAGGVSTYTSGTFPKANIQIVYVLRDVE